MLQNDVYRIHVFHCMVWNIMQDKLEKYCKSIYSKLQLPLIQRLFCSCEKPFKAVFLHKSWWGGRTSSFTVCEQLLAGSSSGLCCGTEAFSLGVMLLPYSLVIFSSTSIFSVQSVHSKCGSSWVVRMPMSFKVSVRNQSSKYFSSKLWRAMVI